MLQGSRHKPTRPIRIIEVGPRDGLQNEPGIVLTEDKVSFVNALSRTGVAEIEIGSFVSPHAIPQLADSDEVFRKIERRPGVTYSALVPNMRGLERAKAVDIQKIAVFTAVSETFAQHNIKCGVRESIDQFAPVVDEAHRNGMTVRGYISTVTHCPFEGPVDPSRVSEVMHRLLQIGVDEISLGTPSERPRRAMCGDFWMKSCRIFSEAVSRSTFMTRMAWPWRMCSRPGRIMASRRLTRLPAG